MRGNHTIIETSNRATDRPGLVARVVRSRVAVAAATAALSASILGGVAYAASSPVDTAGIVHGCYSPTSGALKLLTAPSCRARARGAFRRSASASFRRA